MFVLLKKVIQEVRVLSSVLLLLGLEVIPGAEVVINATQSMLLQTGHVLGEFQFIM